jgi:choline dehydrogenase-like flavoprotein
VLFNHGRAMPCDHDYDFIIIGSGAGGGTLAWKLAPSGKRILIIERGDYLPREKPNWDPTEVFVNNRYVAHDPWHDQHGREFQPEIHYWVGGATKMYGAALFRLRREDFSSRRHYDGVTPGWPVGYDEFEPYYCDAEDLYHVHGLRGEDPTEPAASRPYAYPPIAHEPRIQRLHDDLIKTGRHPFHAPTAVMLDESNRPRSHCLKCDTCDGYPCLAHAKADAEVIAVRPALRHPNMSLLTRAEVTALRTSPSGREVTEVVVNRDGAVQTFRAAIVVVSAGAANSAALLLKSANDRHPRGLANGSDQVGRNYMFHNSQAVVALSLEKNLTQFQKTISLNDFYFRDDDFDFPLGNIQMIGKSKGPMFREDAPFFAPGFALDEMALHSVDFWLTTEDLPHPSNRVTLDRERRIILDYTLNNQVATRRLYDRLKSMLGDLGMHRHLIPNHAYMGKEIPLAGVAHQSGTCRFGTDPATSVLDVNCKAHELDNLYVVDTSFFCSIGAVNPSLTAIANALRVGDHLLARCR